MNTKLPLVVVRGFRGLIAVSLLLMGSLTANASIEYQFNSVFSGDSPGGNAPWVDAYFIDVAPGEVLLTVTNVNLAPGEFVGGHGNGASGGLFFNINTQYNPSDLNFTLVSETSTLFGTSISTGEDAFKADGSGYYDIEIDFSSHSFANDASITYEITGISGLTASDFEQLNEPSGGEGPFYAAAKVQGIPSGSGSGYLDPSGGYTVLGVQSVPEPAPTALMAAGLTLLVARTFRSRRP